jgi:hypothetical protein
MDITPYYWDKNSFYYFLSRDNAESPATIELVPTELGSSTFLLGQLASDVAFAVETNIRSVEIPTTQEAMAICGTSPRYQTELCLHELIMKSAADPS